MKMLIITLLIVTGAYAQEAETVGVIEVDLGRKCEEELQKPEPEAVEDCTPRISSSVDKLAQDVGAILLPDPAETIATCKSLMSLKGYNLEPIKVDLPGDEKPKRNIIVRFTMGLKTVPHKVNTDMTIVGKDGTTEIKNFTMKYDTRWQHLNPGNWNNLQAATNFLHESTWGYQVDVLVEGADKKRTGITLFLDHPKFKGAMAQGKDGDYRSVKTVENKNHGDTSAYAEGDKVYHIQNSHMNIIGGLKLTRDLWVKEFKNGGRLSYSVQAGVGANLGISRVVEAKVEAPENGGSWQEQVSPKAKVQGWTGTAGHAIEYEKGKMAVALTHTLQYSRIKQEYFDGGYVKYSLPHTAVALTVSVNVFNQQKKNQKRERAK